MQNVRVNEFQGIVDQGFHNRLLQTSKEMLQIRNKLLAFEMVAIALVDFAMVPDMVAWRRLEPVQ